MKVQSILITLLALCLCLPALAQDKPLPKDIPALKVLAEKGDARAQVQLASNYYFGRGVPKDLRAAAGWYGKAAVQGSIEGQYALGFMFGSGEGVKKDMAGAYYWLSIAAAGGHKRAIELKPKAAAALTPAQKANAEKAIRNWLAKQSAKPPPGISGFAAGQKAYEAGKYQDAIRLFEAELAAKKWTHRQVRVATIHFYLGNSYGKNGLLDKALEHHHKSLAILLKQLGPEHRLVANGYGNIGKVYHSQSEPDKALEYHQKSLAIRIKQPVPDHIGVAENYNYIGLAYNEKGEYDKALEYHQKSLAIRLKQPVPDHIDVAMSYNNIGLVHADKGEYTKALEYYQQSLAIKLKRLGPDHPDVAISYNNIGGVHLDKNEYDHALKFFQQSLAIKLKQLGPDHPSVARSYNGIGGVYHSQEEYAKALWYYQKSLAIWLKRLGPDHPDVAISYNNIGGVYDDKGEYTKALEYYQQSLAIKLKRLGPDHPDVAISYNNIGFTQHGLNNPTAALTAARKARAIEDKRLAYMLSFTSEHERLAYQQTQYQYILLGTLGSAPDLATAVLHNKGVVLASLLEDQLVAHASTDPAIKDLNRQLTNAKHISNKLQLGLPNASEPKARAQHQAKLKAAMAKVEELQQKMARNVAGLGQARRALSITSRRLRQSLARDTVLLEFIRYVYSLGKDKGQARYGAVVLSRDRAPVWVPLGSAREIDGLSSNYGKHLKDKGITEEQYVSLLRSLHDRLVAPIVRVVPTGTKTLIICPAGQLNFVNFATFLTPKDRFLCEDYTIKYVASGRDLVPSGKKPVPTQQQLVVFANPKYENKPAVQLAATRGHGGATLRSSDRDDLRAALILKLSALPGTQKEADYLKGKSAEWKLAPYVFVGDAAVERTLYNVNSPKILHLATHGMFLEGQPKPKKDGLEPVGLSGQRKDYKGRLTNPMDRSALMFTGATWTSKQWAQGATPDPRNDGILTANEVGTLNLKGTWLVTMSACSTGLGDLRSGEGVMGLRRAFIQAGTRNLLMTLWPVSDKHTVLLMKDFYGRAIKSGDAPTILAEVQKEMLLKFRNNKQWKEVGLPTTRLAVEYAGPFIMSFQGAE